MSMIVHQLDRGWSFRQADGNHEWLPVAVVPTSVHLDLLKQGKIPNPFLDLNELECGWVNDKRWIYRVELPHISEPECGPDAKVVLAFDGLDTISCVKLNGDVILRTGNMFIPYRVDVTKRISSDTKANILEVEFASAFREARKVKEDHPDHKWICWGGDPSRLAVRKAQYHWGWDWGPLLSPCGPWRPVRLEAYTSRITHLQIDYRMTSNLKAVSGTVSVVVEGKPGCQVAFTIARGFDIICKAVTTVKSHGCDVVIPFHIENIQLWYPHGYGEQPLYEVTATLQFEGKALHSTSRRMGFRKVELVQEEDANGNSFFFRINNVDIFCGGSNWIPADSFTPAVSTEKYRQWLQLMVEGNQTMVRIWGGGIYEEDIFYDVCDELGVLVWQDFMFACGNYPAFSDFCKSIEDEAIANLRRIRHHPSLVILVGNNEDYQVQEQSGLTYDYDEKDPQNWLKSDFPARYIYEKLLPDIIAKEAQNIPYHPGSPFSGFGLSTQSPTIGDLHQWNVWHGAQEKYQLYPSLSGRFVSEFGMEAFPYLATIKSFCTNPSELYPGSKTLDFHNKAVGYERRIATYLAENFRMSPNVGLEDWVYLTQLCQAEAMSYAYRGWRRQWEGRKCGGALVWQLNDCWPVISWSIVDYYLRKKPAYYVIKRCLASIAVGVQRKHHDWSVPHEMPKKRIDWDCWVVSSLMESVTATVEMRFVSIGTGMDIKEPLVMKNIRLCRNGTTEVCKGVVDNEKEEPHVLSVRLWIDGEVVARNCDWPQPLKYLDFSEKGVRRVEVLEDREKGRIVLRARQPTKGLVLEERDGLWLSDNTLDVVPGDEQVVFAKGLDKITSRLDWKYLLTPDTTAA